MNQPFYEFTILDEALRYDFVSVGERVITKTIIFETTDSPELFNLVLADVLPNGNYDIHARSNNGDRNKVLATIAQTLRMFFEKYPDASVTFVGSNPIRTRLYQIAISTELVHTFQRFNVYGIKDGQIEPFLKNTNYEAFVILLKKS